MPEVATLPPPGGFARGQSGQKDLEDILNLMQVTGLKEKGDIVRLASGFYPEARTSAKLLLAVDHLWNDYKQRLERPTHEAPQYLAAYAAPIIDCFSVFPNSSERIQKGRER